MNQCKGAVATANCQHLSGVAVCYQKQVLTVEPSEWWGRRDPKPRSAGPRAFRVVCFTDLPGTCAQAPWPKVGPQPCRSHEHIRTYQLCRVGEGSIFRRNTFLELSPAQGKKPRDATPASQGDRGHVQIEGTPPLILGLNSCRAASGGSWLGSCVVAC